MFFFAFDFLSAAFADLFYAEIANDLKKLCAVCAILMLKEGIASVKLI